MKTVAAWILAVVLGASFAFFFYLLLTYNYQWAQILPYRGNLLKGWGVTVAVSASALVLSAVIGAALTAGQLSPVWPARWLSRLYVELIRGTPLLVQILIGYYLVANALQMESKFFIGVCLLAAFAGAYLSEIFRGGIESIAKSQIDSARAIGLTGSQTYRYVVIPQAVRRVLPATAGQFANLIKDSSLLYVIGLGEFTMQARETNANTFSTFAAYLPLAIGYLVLTLPISYWTRRLEERFRYET